jgi:hypothetical protein
MAIRSAVDQPIGQDPGSSCFQALTGEITSGPIHSTVGAAIPMIGPCPSSRDALRSKADTIWLAASLLTLPVTALAARWLASVRALPSFTGRFKLVTFINSWKLGNSAPAELCIDAEAAHTRVLKPCTACQAGADIDQLADL